MYVVKNPLDISMKVFRYVSPNYQLAEYPSQVDPESHSFTITIKGDLSNIQSVHDNYCAVLNENVPHKP